MHFHPRKRWFAVCTKPGNEKRLARKIHRKGFVLYLPVCGKVPLFPGIVLINIQDSDIQAIRPIDGVIDYLYWLQLPATISDEEVAQLQLFCSVGIDITVSKSPLLRSKTPISIQIEENLNDGQRLREKPLAKLALPSLGYTLQGAIVSHSGVETWLKKPNQKHVYENAIIQ